MKKLILLLALFLLTIQNSLAYYPDYHFRTLQWGMKKDAVIRAEGKPETTFPYEDGEVYEYRKDLNGRESVFFAVFNPYEQLTSAHHAVMGGFEDGTEAMEYLEKVNDSVRLAFGYRADRKLDWLVPEQESAYENRLAEALELGYLRIKYWYLEHSTTEISIYLHKAEGKLELLLMYSPSLEYINNSYR